MKLDFIWITKYWRPILTKEVAVGIRKLVREVCLAKDVQILKGYV
jgi:REP element-mobilizing transposase RayT